MQPTARSTYLTRVSKIISALAAILVVSSTAHADTNIVTGFVSKVEVVAASAGGTAYSVRVWLIGNSILCAGQTWAYINVGDANYNAMVAGLMTAKAAGSQITLYVGSDGSGFCQLNYFDVT